MMDMKTRLKTPTKKSVALAKYLCIRCQETFEVIGVHLPGYLRCPYCTGSEITIFAACRLEIGPPPWVYTCRHCDISFRVQSPEGPDEAKAIRCLKCGGGELKWHVGDTQECPSGG
jgi:DNA-directed RNA polymerase subunit RPC12/RpoP